MTADVHHRVALIGTPVLETERLTLRAPIAADFEGWAAFYADPQTMRFLDGPQPREAAWRALATMAGLWALRGFGMFSVIHRQSGRWIGRVGPWKPEGWPGDEVGWGILREFEGQGYAYEASVATMDWAFDALGWASVIHCIPDANVRSSTLAQRLGSTRQRLVKLPPPAGTEVWMWGQTREQWRARDRRRSGPTSHPNSTPSRLAD